MLKNMVAIDSEFFEIIFNTSKAEKHKKISPYILMRSNFNWLHPEDMSLGFLN